MKWPWQDRGAEAEQHALEEAREQLEKIRGQWPRVEAAVESMRQHRQRNHFAQSIEAIYTGRRP